MNEMPDSGPRAAERIARTITLVLLAAALFLGGISVGAMYAAHPYLLFWYTPVAVAIVFGGLIALTVVTLLVSLRGIRIAHGVYAIAFVVAQLAWVPALVSPMPETLNPWVLEMSAIGTVPAAVAWRPWLAWVYLLVCSAIVAPVRFIANGGVDWTSPLEYSLLTLTLAGLFTALATVAMRNAATVDAGTAELREIAARSAAAAALAQEQVRLDALVHDEVMSTLYYASRGDVELDASVRRQAAGAIAQLERLRGGLHEPDTGVTPDEFVSRIRSVVFAASTTMGFEVRGSREDAVPSEVAAAFAEATSEASRNSLVHARRATTRTVIVEFSPRRIRVVVTDDGDGFDLRDVAPHRLGISVSIRGRLAALPGGRAHVHSSSGSGTTVALDWRES